MVPKKPKTEEVIYETTLEVEDNDNPASLPNYVEWVAEALRRVSELMEKQKSN